MDCLVVGLARRTVGKANGQAGRQAGRRIGWTDGWMDHSFCLLALLLFPLSKSISTINQFEGCVCLSISQLSIVLVSRSFLALSLYPLSETKFAWQASGVGSAQGLRCCCCWWWCLNKTALFSWQLAILLLSSCDWVVCKNAIYGRLESHKAP